MSAHSGYFYTLWLIVNGVEEISKIQGQILVPKTLFLLKTASICQGTPTMIPKQNDALSVMSYLVVSITTAAILRRFERVG
jgi:hypothetical protein